MKLNRNHGGNFLTKEMKHDGIVLFEISYQ